MSAPPLKSPDLADEAKFLESIRADYERQGFTFTVHPSKGLPAFMESYKPDAIATKGDEKIAIEVKNRRDRMSENVVARIRAVFEGHSDWKLHVAYMGSETNSSLSIPASGFALVHDKAADVRWLTLQGKSGPAFILAWSLLEAAARTAVKGAPSRPWTPGTVIQALATEGLIEKDLEERLRPLVEVRNRVVHGELTLEPTTTEIDTVLQAIDVVSHAQQSA